jgi:glycosyltransferase involved in cell wall biosynthesis
VHFAGFRADVPAVLLASDLLVLPSRWEGMPNVVLEAMAAGRPVVATDVAGVREVLGSSSHSQLCPVARPGEFADQMIAILSDEALAARLGGENRLRAIRDFSFAAMVAAYEQLYAGLISGGP